VFSCFALPNSFWEIPRPSWLVSKFCAPGHVFGDSGAVRSCFHVLHSLTHFLRYRGRRGSFSCLRSRALFGRYRGRRVPILFFAVPDSFKAVPRASGAIFKFCAPGHVFCGTVGIEVCFQVLRSGTFFCCTNGVGYHFQVFLTRTRFRWYGRRQGSFSCFALPDSFWALP
jgi:hypothetical protein